MRGTKAPKAQKPMSVTLLLLLILAFIVAAAIIYVPYHAGELDQLLSTAPKPNKPITENITSSHLENTKSSAITTSIPQHVPSRRVEPLSSVIPVGSEVDTIANDVRILLQNHPIHKLSVLQRSTMSLEDHFVYLRNQSECAQIPIFTSMANVFSDMYWQLIENFIYTMAKFHVSSCTLMVCVSDAKCMQLCAASHFPCVDFQYGHFHPGAPLPSALEQIGELKLLHLPKALQKGVDILMLDLDVGFMDDPMKIVHKLDHSKSDIFVQMDITFIMNRTLEGWRTWYTAPQPNIGIMLCRGNAKSTKMFDIAWRDYKAINQPIKHNPGKDQNKVVFAMRVARRYGLRWEYIPEANAVLLDKIYKNGITSYELGGEAAERVLHDKGAFAAHTTCYEQKSKVMGLKAANAFWNPIYYDPLRRTITKQLIYLNDQQLRWEVRSLLYLAMATNRAVIIPNILGNELNEDVQLFDGQAMWPGFRTAYFKKGFPHAVHILEPAFYWRVRCDYVKHADSVPMPRVASLHALQQSPATINELEQLLLSEEWTNTPRVVLHAPPTKSVGKAPDEATLQRILRWAEDSVGRYEGSYDVESKRYGRLPNLGEDRKAKGTKTEALTLSRVAERIMTDVRLCDQLMHPNMGNRSCFDKCK